MIASAVTDQVQYLMDKKLINCYDQQKIQTCLFPARKFYPAHTRHQEFFDKKPDAYCSHFRMFTWDWNKMMAAMYYTENLQEDYNDEYPYYDEDEDQEQDNQ